MKQSTFLSRRTIEEMTTRHSFLLLDEPPQTRTHRRSMPHTAPPTSSAPVLLRMLELLAKKVRNKKCYCLQILKQFIMYS